MLGVTTTYSGFEGLMPSRNPEEAKTDNVPLAPGAYAQGTVLGQVSTTTGTNDVQTITFANATGGTFILSFNGVLTGAITWSGTAATMVANLQAAFDALSNVGAGNSVVAGTGPYTVTFQGAMANLYEPLILVAANNLTSGSTATITIAHTTPGIAAGGHFAAYASGNSDGTQTARAVLKYATTVDTYGHTTFGGGEWGASQYLGATVYTSGTFFTGTGTALNLPGLDSTAVSSLGRLLIGTTSTLTAAGTELRFS